MKMNNKVLTVGLALMTLMFFSSVKANADLMEDKAQTEFTDSLTFGPAISSITYEEPNFMEESGMFYGAEADYAARFPQRVVLMVQGRLLYGQVDYTSQGTGSIDNIHDLLGEIRGMVGYDIYAFDATRLTPYGGIGYRYLLDQSGGRISTTGAYGYDREANYFYVPIGVTALTELDGGWSLGFTAEYDFFIQGYQKSHLGDVVAGLDVLENKQNKGWGARGSVELVKKLNNFELVVEPFMKYWNIEQSETQTITFSGTPIGAQGYEPENNSTEYGLKLGMRF